MSQVDFQIKIGVATQLEQLRAMESQFAKQIVQLRTLGTGGADALQKVEKNLGLVRSQLASIGGMGKASAAVGDVFKSIPVVGTAMNMLNGSAAAVGGALAVAAYAANQFHASLQFADNLQDVSEQLGVSASNLQALNAHFGDAGIKAPQVAQTMQRLSLALAGAASGSQPLITAFSSLGLSVETLRGLAPDEALARVGAALAAHAGSAEAAAAATAILGRGTGKLLAALKELGAAGLEKTTSAMTEAGRVLDDAMVKKLAAANQKLEELDQRWTIFKAGLVGIVLPGDPITGPRGRAGAYAKVNQPPAPAARSALEALAAQPLKPVKTEAEILRATQSSRRVAPELLEKNRGKLRAESQANQLSNAPILAARAELATLAATKKATLDAAEAAKALAEAKAPILAEQAKLDAAIDAAQTKQLDLATQLALAEDARHRVIMQMPAAEEQSVQAAKDRLALTTQLAAIDADIVVTKNAQAEADKALAEKAAKAIADAKELKLKEEQLAAARRIATGDAAISNLKNDPLALNETKRKGEIALYAEQNRFIKERIDLLNKERESATDVRRGQIDSEVSGLNAKAGENNISSINAQAKSIGTGATQGAVEYLNSIPDAAGRASVAVLSVAQGLENGIGSSLQGLINQTMTWGQALANIGQSIVDSIIGAFVRMAAQWITQQIVMAVFGNAIRAAQLAALLPVTSATLAMWAPAATAASIATMGGAAVTGAAASKAAIISSVAGFAEGGPVSGPGTGTSDSIPAWLSNGEYVMPADKTAQYRPLLDSMRAGTLNPGQLAAAPGAGGGGGGATLNSSVNMAFFDSRLSAEQWAKSSEGEAHFVDVAQRNFHRISGTG